LRTDVTVTLPFLVSAVLSDNKLRRKPLRLFDAMAEAEAELDRAVAKAEKKAQRKKKS
jgi:deoxyhypusine synthase